MSTLRKTLLQVCAVATLAFLPAAALANAPTQDYDKSVKVEKTGVHFGVYYGRPYARGYYRPYYRPYRHYGSYYRYRHYSRPYYARPYHYGSYRPHYGPRYPSW